VNSSGYATLKALLFSDPHDKFSRAVSDIGGANYASRDIVDIAKRSAPSSAKGSAKLRRPALTLVS